MHPTVSSVVTVTSAVHLRSVRWSVWKRFRIILENKNRKEMGCLRMDSSFYFVIMNAIDIWLYQIPKGKIYKNEERKLCETPNIRHYN